MEEDLLSEEACEKILHEVAEVMLVVLDLLEGRANGSEDDAVAGSEEIVSAFVPSATEAVMRDSRGDAVRAVSLPEEADDEAASPAVAATQADNED